MRATLIFILKALIGGGLLAFVISRIPLQDALSVAVTIDPATLAVAVALYFLAHAVNAAKLQVFLPDLSIWQAWRFTMIGVFYGTALPGQIAGDAVKAVRLARAHADGDEGAAVAAVTVDKIVGIFALLLLVAFAIGIEAQAFDRAVVLTAALAAAVAVAGLVAAFLLPMPAWLGRFGASVSAWRSVSMRPMRLSYALLLGVLFQALCVAICMILGAQLNIVLSAAAWTVVMGFSAIVLLAPITIAGIGVREATLVGAIGYLGGSAVGAFALSLVLFVINLIGAVVGLAVDLAGRDKVT